jgi:glycosyltransferase involved in cell wall biosynthesis
MAARMLTPVLMIAFHFPPAKGSSGIQRTLKFCTYLRDHGFAPIVLTAHARAHEQISADQIDEIPKDVPVERAFALDSARHLSIRGRYPARLALPDRWSSWRLGGVAAGLRLIRRYRPALIWSTFPIATAHRIGLDLQRLTGIPWVADFRDSMTEEDYPRDARTWRMWRAIESETIGRCARAVFTTPGARRLYVERYPKIPADRLCVIENGFDEDNFRSAASNPVRAAGGSGPAILLHSGILYPSERDPTAFFDALADLARTRPALARELRVVLRASGHDHVFRAPIAQRGLDNIVTLAPPLGYQQALAEMLDADGLLLLQAANCNHQIPAKAYEYLRAGAPIVALTDAAGDTAQLLSSAGCRYLAALDDRSAIAATLHRWLDDRAAGRCVNVPLDVASRYSRRARTGELARLFESVLGMRG